MGRYTLSLAQALSGQDGPEQLGFLANARVLQSLPASGDSDSGSVTIPPRSLPRLRRLASASLLMQILYTRANAISQRVRIRMASPDVVHGTNFWLPPSRAAGVLTIHDLSLYVHPECHPRSRLRIVIPQIEQSLKRASMILTGAECIRHAVMRQFGLPPERVAAVPHGCSPRFRPRAPVDISAALADHGLEPGRYALYVGTVEPRKNIACLLDAYESLPRALRQARPLVLSGDFGWNSEALHQRMRTARQQGWVQYLGYVPDTLLPALYAGARVFVYPSRYEGFGLPVLEAMASGTPVVCSDIPPLVEVAADSGLMAAVADVDGLRAAIEQALTDDDWWQAAREAGLARASTFTWERTARETVAVYRRALTGTA